MAGVGGARPGAGRPRKLDKNAGAIVKAEKQIRDRLPEIVDAQISLALGITVQDKDSAGNTIVYSRPPDVKAGQYLIDRIMGKPTQRQEISGPDTTPIQVEHIPYEYKNAIADIAPPDAKA